MAAASSEEQSPEQVRYLQQRVALFGKVWTGVATFTLVVRAVTILLGGQAKDFADAGFLFQVASLPAVLVMWLACRTGERTYRFIRGVEAAGLLGGAVAFGFMGRTLAPAVLSDARQVWGVASDGELGGFVSVFVHQYFGLVTVFALMSMLVLRSALVPSTGRLSLLLSTAIGAVAIAILAYDHHPQGIMKMGDPQVALIMSTAAYWLVVIAICVVLTKVVHGLRRQVREAQRLGQYTLEAKLGEGGMGVVYRARHAMLRRPTAVKLLHPDKLGERAIARFEREVQLTAQLTHPNTVTIFDYGRTPDGLFYYAMELLRGATLEEVVRVGGPMPAARVVHVLLMVAGALAEAHELGLIHRDVKPANIVLGNRGAKHDVATVVDFGLVKEIDKQQAVDLTHEGVVAGTPLYLSPETLRSPDQVDARTDLYALGAVAYFLLSGEPPFTGGTVVEICSHHLHTEPTPPSERLGQALPTGLERLILRCLAKEPDARPQSASELESELSALDVGVWTQDEARSWWQRHGEAVDELRRAEEQSVSAGKTIAVHPGRLERA